MPKRLIKRKKTALKMNSIDKVNDLLDNQDQYPEKRVRREKKERGLYERTSDVHIITEDNKMLLND